MSKTKYSYLQENRLADIIRLIAVLGKQSKHSFRTNEGITTELNGIPKSAEAWTNIAEEHPEFFKFNKDKTSIVLLLRYLNSEDENGDSYRALDIDQTQKLIDQAISLHDKQIARYQRNNFIIPLIAAVITALVTITVSTITYYSSKSNNKEILNKLDNINLRLNKIDNNQQKSSNHNSKTK